MKKPVKIALIVVVALVAAFFGLKTYTKSHSPAETVKADQNGLNVEVNYCQPSMKGRKIFGELVPFGKVWRTGANEATIIKFNKDVRIAGQPLKAGNYTLWTIPNQNSWTIIFNSETGQWGTNYDAKTDVLKVDVPSAQSASAVEQFKINLNPTGTGIDMTLNWENTEVKVPIQ